MFLERGLRPLSVLTPSSPVPYLIRDNTGEGGQGNAK